jgi:threonine/homoserine/homoserine lactone efflux protein
MSYTEPVISGIVFGLIISIMIGPVFFALIQTSLQEGFKAGSHLAFGVMMSDAAYIAFCYFFASQLDLTGAHKIATGIIGGIVLIGFGIYQGMKKIRLAEIEKKEKAFHARYALHGFIMNGANPAVLLFWLSVVSQVKLKEQYSTSHEVFFFLASLFTVFSIDLGKSYAAHRIKKVLKPHVMKIVNRVIGLILCGYGIWMIGKPLGWWKWLV